MPAGYWTADRLLHYCTPKIWRWTGCGARFGTERFLFRDRLESNRAGNAEKPSLSKGKKIRLCLGDSLALYLHIFVSA